MGDPVLLISCATKLHETRPFAILGSNGCPGCGFRLRRRGASSGCRGHRTRTSPAGTAGASGAHPTGQRRHCAQLAGRCFSEGGNRTERERVRARSRPPPLALRAPERRCAGCRNQRSLPARRRERHPRILLQVLPGESRRRSAEQEPDHSAPRRRWRRCG